MLRKEHYRDLAKWRRTKQLQKRRYYASTATGRGMPRWTSDEDAVVERHDMTDREISKAIGRSMGAIQKRRWVLKNFKGQ